MKRHPGEFFREAKPPYVAVDAYLNGALVLVLGHWVNADGREVAAEVTLSSSRRRLTDLRPVPPAPAFKPFEDGR